jgi:hypothetical protein
MQPEKKQLEILLVNYFRECFTDFPQGRISPSESPDFIIKLKSRNNLGIELTRLNPVNAKAPDQSGTEQIELREKIISTAKDLFENSSPLKLFVKFVFSENSPVSPEKELVTAVKAVNRIRQAVKNIKPGSLFFETVSDAIPGNELEKILIVSHPSLKFSAWERSNNLGISENITADILTSIQKKEEKLRLYQRQRLNYYWLIITSDQVQGLNNYNLADITGSYNFNSHFQHIFLFDIVKPKIYQLV